MATFRSVRIIGVENMSGVRAKVMLYPFAGWIGSFSPRERTRPSDQAPPARTYSFARNSPFDVLTSVTAPSRASMPVTPAPVTISTPSFATCDAIPSTNFCGLMWVSVP